MSTFGVTCAKSRDDARSRGGVRGGGSGGRAHAGCGDRNGERLPLPAERRVVAVCGAVGGAQRLGQRAAPSFVRRAGRLALGPPGAEKTTACIGQLNRTDDEFWIADQPSCYQHTGLWGSDHATSGPESEGKSWNTTRL